MSKEGRSSTKTDPPVGQGEDVLLDNLASSKKNKTFPYKINKHGKILDFP